MRENLAHLTKTPDGLKTFSFIYFYKINPQITITKSSNPE